MKTVPVIVTWIPKELGGRERLPSDKRYAQLVRFEDDSPDYPSGRWTLVLEFTVPPNEQGNPSRGTAHFMMDEAPANELNAEKVLELYEGKTHVATVLVIQN